MYFTVSYLIKVSCFVLILISYASSDAASLPPDPSNPSSSSSSLCSQYKDEIELSLQNIASENASSVADNSAPRETYRQLKINNELHRVSINLELMQKNACSVSGLTIPHRAYAVSAMDCQAANSDRLLNAMRNGTVQADAPVDCDRKNWERDISP